MIKLQPVILCGGQGTRLWPLSNKYIPKQFVRIGSKGTLLEQTIKRIKLITDECCNYEIFDPLLIMNNDHKLPDELIAHEKNVIYETYANDTSVAIARAALEIKNRHDDQKIIVLVLPADHYIENSKRFICDITKGISNVTDDNIVLYGIEPTAPETKYGYIIPNVNGVSFKEKPNSEIAADLIKQNALWNSGIFVSQVDTIITCLNNSSHNILDWIINPRDGKAPSFDVAVLQEYNKIYAHHCLEWGWNDVGTWESFTTISEIITEMQTSTNNITKDCNNINIINRNTGNIVVIGCSDLLVVNNGPDLLIMSNKGDFNNELKEIATRIAK